MKYLGILLLAVLVCANLAEAQGTRPARTAVSATAASPRTTTLPIRRVILYSNGVAYIERRGTVTGNADIDLEGLRGIRRLLVYSEISINVESLNNAETTNRERKSFARIIEPRDGS